MAQNGQLVAGEDAALKALAALSTEQSFMRAVTPYTAEDKQLPGLPRRPHRGRRLDRGRRRAPAARGRARRLRRRDE